MKGEKPPRAEQPEIVFVGPELTDEHELPDQSLGKEWTPKAMKKVKKLFAEFDAASKGKTDVPKILEQAGHQVFPQLEDWVVQAIIQNGLPQIRRELTRNEPSLYGIPPDNIAQILRKAIALLRENA